MNPPIAWSQTMFVLGGLVGLLGVVALILNVVEKSKKVFMRHPPMEYALKSETISPMILQERLEKFENRIDQRFTDQDIKRERQINEIHDRINDVAADTAFIRGRMEKRS